MEWRTVPTGQDNITTNTTNATTTTTTTTTTPTTTNTTSGDSSSTVKRKNRLRQTFSTPTPHSSTSTSSLIRTPTYGSSTPTAPPSIPTDDIVYLNVGGYKYTTSASTLQARGMNFLSALITHDRDNKIPARRDKDGYIWIDRNGKLFSVILEYLRTGKLFIPSDTSREQVEAELDFYQILDHQYSNDGVGGSGGVVGGVGGVTVGGSPRGSGVGGVVGSGGCSGVGSGEMDPERVSFYELVHRQSNRIVQSVTRWLELNESKIFALMKKDVKEDSPKTEITLYFHLDYSRTSSLGTPWVCDTRVSLVLPPEYVPSEPNAVLNSVWMRMLCSIILDEWKLNCRFFCSSGPPKLQLTLDWSPCICKKNITNEEIFKLLQTFYLETTSINSKRF